MNVVAHASVLIGDIEQRLTRWMLSHRIRANNPTLRCDPTTIWNYPYHAVDAIQIGQNCQILAHCEIVVFPISKHSSVEGRLILEDGAVISTGCNVRAAGGVIRIGAGSAIGQNTVVVAANHRAILGVPYFNTPWDETKVGVDIGTNVWVSASCVLLPGISIGNNSLIAAGSVVTKNVPADEIWGGVPARRIKAVPGPDELAAPNS